MKCPSCSFEPVAALLKSPCPRCGGGWADTDDYVAMLADQLTVDRVLDVGCGLKGVIAQDYWENVRAIKQGYACDRFILKPLPKLWTSLIADAEILPSLIDPVDVVTHCGLLEHLPYEKAFRVLYALEQVATKLIVFSGSTELRQVDYKVKRDGNPYHYYRSWWDGATLEALGYHVDRKRMAAHKTFWREAMGWVYTAHLSEPWEVRRARAMRRIAERRCCVSGCNAEPFVWVVCEGDNCYCAFHYVEKFGEEAQDVRWWLSQSVVEVEEHLKECRPSWREEKLVPRLEGSR